MTSRLNEDTGKVLFRHSIRESINANTKTEAKNAKPNALRISYV